MSRLRGRPLNLADLCRQKGYTAFAEALKTTRMDKVVDHEGHFTIFAPTNAAFENPKTYPSGRGHSMSLYDRVAYHIAKGLIKESSVKDEMKVPTLLSKRTIRFNVYGEVRISCFYSSVIYKA